MDENESELHSEVDQSLKTNLGARPTKDKVKEAVYVKVKGVQTEKWTMTDKHLDDTIMSTSMHKTSKQLNTQNIKTDKSDLSTEYIPTIYSEKTVITVQPHSYAGLRHPMPIPTVGELTAGNLGSFIPLTGLQFLAGVERLDIQQTVELHDLLSKIESENRYVLKTSGGETLFVGAETSTDCQRLCCGSARGYQLTLVDPTRQTAVTFVRRLACSAGMCGCFLQRLDVYIPLWDHLGSIQQEWTLLTPRFAVRDESDTKLFLVEGPRMCTCAMYKDATFQVLNAETGTQVASISHSWEHTQVNYNLSLTFPSQHLENKQKALLIGAAFLLEYMFFEQAKKTRCCSCF